MTVDRKTNRGKEVVELGVSGMKELRSYD